jgi:hypothetical protein
VWCDRNGTLHPNESGVCYEQFLSTGQARREQINASFLLRWSLCWQLLWVELGGCAQDDAARVSGFSGQAQSIGNNSTQGW